MMKKMLPMKEVLWLVVHCTATKPNVQVTVDDLDRMHAARGWARCGYHWVIQPDGTIQAGRPETMAGAHLRMERMPIRVRLNRKQPFTSS